MTKYFCHEEYYVPIHKEDHFKVFSAEKFIGFAVVLFTSVFVAAVICGVLIESFTL